MSKAPKREPSYYLCATPQGGLVAMRTDAVPNPPRWSFALKEAVALGFTPQQIKDALDKADEAAR